MIVGTLKLHLLIRESRSLKDKRRVVKSIKDRVRSEFNVSIAELEALDSHQQVVLGAATVSNERRAAQAVLTQVVNMLRTHPVAQLVDFQLEV